MRISIVFCEGVHDIAFIMKIMKTYGYTEPKLTIDKYPYPLSNIYKTSKKKIGIYSRDTNRMPFAALEKAERMIVFHKMGGDSFVKDIIEIVELYKKSKILLDFDNPDNIDTYEFIFFNDADEIGVQDRIESISKAFDGKYNMQQGEKIAKEEFFWGVYIFCDPLAGRGKGDLEDLLLHLMEPDNKTIFEASRDFLRANALDEERQKKYDSFKDKYTGSAKKNYKNKKSIIGVAGQLQFSGEANTVMIEYSDYITKDKIENSQECRDIFKLLNDYQ